MTTHSTGRHSLKLALGAVLGILLALPALAAQQFTILDYPGSTGTLVLGLNARGVAAGYTLDTPEIPFYYDLRKRLFIPIAPIPGFDATEVWNLNDKGTVVGIAHANDYSTETAFFRDADGNVTLLPHPGLTFSEAQGINDRGIVVGEAWNADFSQAVGYVYNPADHSFTDFLPSADTEVHGINRRGEIVGGVHLLAGAIYPNSPEGQYGFYRAVNGRITLFRVNESTGGTMPRAINDEGVIAGEIFTPTGAVGFVIRLEELRRAGRAPYARIAAPVLLVPGQAETYIQQVTDEGQLAGATIDADGVVHGFVSRER